MRWLSIFLLVSALASDHALVQQVPLKETDRMNPYAGQAEATRAGHKIFERECAACHGDAAQGGKRAPALASPAIREASSGQIFWVLKNGSMKHGMPSFSHLPEQQRWQVVTYLKTL